VLTDISIQISLRDIIMSVLPVSEPSPFSVGSLYLIAFAQARAPHIGIILPTSLSSGILFHIRIDRNASPNWTYQTRLQNIAQDMFVTSLLRIRDVNIGGITLEQLTSVAKSVAVPENDEFGECFPWVLKVVEMLHTNGYLTVSSLSGLQDEFCAFANGNRAYARRDKFPNVAISTFCM
jgi:hypothetical protein